MIVQAGQGVQALARFPGWGTALSGAADWNRPDRLAKVNPGHCHSREPARAPYLLGDARSLICQKGLSNR
jgi:hypothetical protein